MFKHRLSVNVEKSSKIIALDLSPTVTYLTIDSSRSSSVPQSPQPPRAPGKFGFSRIRKALSTMNFLERRGSRAPPIALAASPAPLLQPAGLPWRHQLSADVEMEAPAYTDELIPHPDSGLFSLRMIFYSTSPSLFQSNSHPISSLSGAAAQTICP
jgi:hypothetical protein